MSILEFHEAANIFPLDEEHIAELADDIRKHGQRVPIELLDGKILDGRRRFLACEHAGVKPTFRPVSPADPVAYVLSLNMHRRHLSPTQLAMAGARAREIYDRQAKERQKNHGGTSPGKGKTLPVNLPEPIQSDARDAVGKVVGVSGKSIDYATNVLKNGTPKLIAAVEADIVAVSTASRTSSFSEEEQSALVDRAKEKQARGDKKRDRPAADKVTVATDDDEEPEREPDPDNNPEDRKSRGKGVALAHEAINCLSRIPKNDALRKRGFQLVSDWLKLYR